MKPVLLDLPITPGQRIDSLFVWIVTYPGGDQGIMSGDVEIPGLGMRHIPFMSSKQHLAEALKPRVDQCAETAREQGGVFTADLVEFRRV